MKQITIFGYGSLINPESLKATVPDAHNISPAYIKGFKREFSLWDPQGWTETNLDLKGQPFCALDVRKIADSKVKVNGVIFSMSEANHAKLLEREAEYEFISTNAYDFETGKSLGECLAFSANKNNGTYDFDSAAQERYLEVCLKAARQYGKQFYQEFLISTFIGSKSLAEISGIRI